MNPLQQNNNMSYPNMMNYPMNFQQNQIDPSNPIQYQFPQSQAQRLQYQYLLNNKLSQLPIQPQIQVNPNLNQHKENPIINTDNANNITLLNKTVPENPTPQTDKNKITNAEAKLPPIKLLTKYKDIYVPSIYLIDYNDLNKSPFNILAANSNQIQTQTYNQLGVSINNNQNNIILPQYFNYGYNLEEWKKHVESKKNKFDELNNLVKNGVIRLPPPDNELEYLMAFPSDYGGLGRLQNEQNYDNVNFYDEKDIDNNPDDFMSLIKFDRDQTWYPLKYLNKQIKDNILINYSNMKYCLPQTFLINQNIPYNGQEATNNENIQNKEK